MTTHPQVLAVRRGEGGVELDLHVPARLSWFPHHFPRFHMLPGVVQTAWAIAFARQHLGLTGSFRRLTGLKFQHPILPAERVTLNLGSPAAGELVFAYRNGGRACSGGRIQFDPPARSHD